MFRTFTNKLARALSFIFFMKLSFLYSKIDTSIISYSDAILLIKSVKSCIIDRTESMRLRTMKMKQISDTTLKITMSLEDLMDR